VPAVRAITTAEDDWLFLIKPGAYHGHPNPAAGHFVLNGGNPTHAFDFAETVQYPPGTAPDRDFNPAVEVLGQHISANGLIEYRGDAFGGRLDGRLLICRYSRGNDILILTLDPSGRVVDRQFGIPGLCDMDNPLDIAQHPATGNLYVTDLGRQVVYLARPRR
jgi:glucose/arabinose dehydrogenase